MEPKLTEPTEQGEKKIQETLAIFTNRHNLLILLIVVVLSVASILAGELTKPLLHQTPTMKYLDEKAATTATLSAVTAISATGLALVPDDSTTPLANHIMDFSTCLLVVTFAILLEKLITTISVYVFLVIVIPLLLAMWYLVYVWKKANLIPIMAKILVIAICFVLLIPVCCSVGDIIDHSSVMPQFSSSTISIGGLEGGNIWDTITGLVSNFASEMAKLGNYVRDVFAYVMNIVAAMFITTCAIPLGIILIFYLLIKRLFSSTIDNLLKKRKEEEENGGKRAHSKIVAHIKARLKIHRE